MDNVYRGHALNPKLQSVYQAVMNELSQYGRQEDRYYCRRLNRYVSEQEVNKVAALERVLQSLEDAHQVESIHELLRDNVPDFVDQETLGRWEATLSFHQELAEVHDRVQAQHHLNCTCDECTSAITDYGDDDYSPIYGSESADDSLGLPVEYDAKGRKLNPYEGIGGYHNQIGGYSCPNCRDQGCWQCQSWDQLCM